MLKNCFYATALLLLACSNTPGDKRTPSADSISTQVPVSEKTPLETPKPDVRETLPVPAPILRKPTPSTVPKITEPGVAEPVPAKVQRTPGETRIETPELPSWDALLSKYVSATGKVNYKGLLTERAVLDAYLQSLSANPPQSNWSRAEKMAFWINAYNAFTIDLILDHYPLNSITQLDGGKPWSVKRIALGGAKYSLDQIENEILRPQFRDARLHFALNCAARSCPPLWNRAFTPDKLETALEDRARRFINDPKYNTLGTDKASVSKIFEWYAADFGDLPAFLNRYAAGVQLAPGAAIEYREYDWNLNEQ